MDKQITALFNAKLHEQACSTERVYFVKTDRMSNPRKITPFKYWEGRLPVLVSAPHAVRHFRQKKIKPSDEFTGSMACLLNSLTGCHSLAVVKLYGGDPNYDPDCLYKDTIRDICSRCGIKLVIDLHGASREHGFDVDIGTKNGRSILGHTKYVHLLKQVLERSGVRDISENRFTVSDQMTVTSFVSGTLKVPAVQLEISKKYRVPHQNGLEYCRLMAALSEFIKSATGLNKLGE